ncbi:TPA: hypothetical protein ACGQRB_000228 [Streptococcus agalactiae]
MTKKQKQITASIVTLLFSLLAIGLGESKSLPNDHILKQVTDLIISNESGKILPLKMYQELLVESYLNLF